MEIETEGSEVVLPGRHMRPSRNLYPIAKRLIARGHPPLEEAEKFGFCPGASGMVCRLGRKFTPEDWQAINDQLVLPETIVFLQGPKMAVIRDEANLIDIIGYDELLWDGETISIDQWEKRIRGD